LLCYLNQNAAFPDSRFSRRYEVILALNAASRKGAL
jgi:hypothetical protein